MIVHCFATRFATAGPVDPENWVDTRGGSNKNFFMRMVKELPKHGHTVRAFSTFPRSSVRDGVEYTPLKEWVEADERGELDLYGKPDVMWACYDTTPLKGRSGCLRIASHHTYKIDWAPWSSIDINTIPSQAALDYVKARYAPKARWAIQPNAVEEDLPARTPVPGRVIYHTSWSRGLHVLAAMWPRIRAAVPDATLHVVSNLPKREVPLWGPSDLTQLIDWTRHREFWSIWEAAQAAGGVVHMQNVPRARVLQELAEASVFAFPCTTVFPVETFSVSTMECCKMGIPVVLAPEDALESIYRGSVLLTSTPVTEYQDEFVEAVVRVLRDPSVAARYVEQGKALAAPYTYANAGKALSDIIHTGLRPETPPAPQVPEIRMLKPGKTQLAFLLDPSDCGRVIDPERIEHDPRGLTGTDVTSYHLALEMARRGHDVTWYANVTQNHVGRGIEFARWERWELESKRPWHAAVATINPWGLEKAGPGTLRVFNQQINDFGKYPGWEQYTDVITALSHAHQKQLQRFTDFATWEILPNGCDPSEYTDGPRDNRRMVWASSPDRGLHWMLELFPHLRKRVPDAELHIYYMYVAEAENGTGETANRFKYMNRALERLRGKGVTFHGQVSRREIAQAFCESRVLAYTCDPTGFTEGFSCTTLEAAVSGCLPVICGADALTEIYGDYVPTTPPPYPDHRDHYFQNLVRYLTDDDAYRAAQTRAKQMAHTHNWQVIGDKLERILKLQ